MKTRLWLVALLTLSAATLGACGGDDEETPAGGAGGEAGNTDDAGAGTGGSGGTGGGGTGGSGGTGGGAPLPMPITCGSMTCNPPANPLAMFAGALGGGLPMAYACCLPDDECGYAMSENATGDACNEPAVEDDRCADFMLDLGPLGGMADAGAALPPIEGGFGCCTEDNQCGVDGSLFGTGCNENSVAKTMLSSAIPIPLIGPLIAAGIPDPKACDAPLPDAGPGDEDGGM